RLLRAFQVVYLGPIVAAVILNQRYAGSVPSIWWIGLAATATTGLIFDMVRSRLKARPAMDTSLSPARGVFAATSPAGGVGTVNITRKTAGISVPRGVYVLA